MRVLLLLLLFAVGGCNRDGDALPLPDMATDAGADGSDGASCTCQLAGDAGACAPGCPGGLCLVCQ